MGIGKCTMLRYQIGIRTSLIKGVNVSRAHLVVVRWFISAVSFISYWKRYRKGFSQSKLEEQ